MRDVLYCEECGARSGDAPGEPLRRRGRLHIRPSSNFGVLIGYDEAGRPVGEVVTFADLPPSSFTVEDSPFVQTPRSANGG